jgi:hypothetical protein
MPGGASEDEVDACSLANRMSHLSSLYQLLVAP